jgi:hypothetical protein
MLVKYICLTNKLFVCRQIQTWNLQIRIPMEIKSWINKRNTCFPYTSNLCQCNTNNTLIMVDILLTIAFYSLTQVAGLCMFYTQTIISHSLLNITIYMFWSTLPLAWCKFQMEFLKHVVE